MTGRSRWSASGVLCGCLLSGLAACAPADPRPPAGAPVPVELPPLAAPQITLQAAPPRTAQSGDPLAGVSSLQTVTLRAQDVGVRALLTALAEAAGISLVLDPGVEGRMSVHLVDVPVADALRQVLAAANLSVVTPSAVAPWGPVVFYAIPVDIDSASAELIRARFGVSLEVARQLTVDN
ncbi:MAG TPA: hypothetical protein VFZ18_08010 [Longimicrobiaceae bacterium]